MSFSIYLKLTGRKQGLISSGCSTSDSIGNRYQIGHEDEIQVLSFVHSLTREQNSDHHPVDFMKIIDKSSPLLGIAISNNEILNAYFDFYRINSFGVMEKFYTVELRDASIVDICANYPHSIDSSNAIPFETISLAYKSITWKHHIAGTSGYSIWDDRVY
ncbi:Hcp family type VI secretion system effector [Photorhabdus cinerea]|uniref:Type VI secretion system tube protein Hcp n=2 Tax=Photorhabdus TaxID=29487 RepID=A0A7X5TIN2_9GAMM|nr:Hcp family type VI secretion system effector [Photorhabdus cinerea]NHB93424.1 type VI secretion system tube protein Hcp [Photorhabdus cinerea]